MAICQSGRGQNHWVIFIGSARHELHPAMSPTLTNVSDNPQTRKHHAYIFLNQTQKLERFILRLFLDICVKLQCPFSTGNLSLCDFWHLTLLALDIDFIHSFPTGMECSSWLSGVIVIMPACRLICNVDIIARAVDTLLQIVKSATI